jgi:anti-anti-sigma factor
MEISQLGSSERMIEFALAGDIVQHYVTPSITSQFAELNGSSVFGRAVLVDVSDVTFLDSNGIGWFVAIDSQFRKNGGRLILHSPSPVLQRIFAMLKITTVITVVPSRDAALAVVNEVAQPDRDASVSNESIVDTAASQMESGESP